MFGMAVFSTPAHLSAPGAAAVPSSGLTSGPASVPASVPASAPASVPADGLRR